MKKFNFPVVAILSNQNDLKILNEILGENTTEVKTKSSKAKPAKKEKSKKKITRNMPKGIIRGTKTGRNSYTRQDGKVIFTIEDPRTGDWQVFNVRKPNKVIYFSRKESRDDIRSACAHILKCDFINTRSQRYIREKQGKLFG